MSQYVDKTSLEEFLELEIQKGLYNYELDSIKLWNIFRMHYRYEYISKKSGVESITNKNSFFKFILYQLLNSFISFKKIVSIILKRKTYQNVIVANGRLLKDENVFFDKFTDPVIDKSLLRNNCCILQLPMSFMYYKRRRHKDIVVPVDFFKQMSYVLIPFYTIFFFVKGDYRVIYKLYNRARELVHMSFLDLVLMNVHYIRLKLTQQMYVIFLRLLKTRRVFGVARRNFMDITMAAHKLNLIVYEFQHGVTLGETAYYSGPQCHLLDPDYFLSFGPLWNGHQFGISPDKIINIGWAYKDEQSKDDITIIPKSVMVVSSPQITHNLLALVKDLALLYPDYSFHIRLHPYEKYGIDQLKVVESVSNLYLCDTSIDSRKALCSYNYVIGENSSVVFEALSMGKRVGRICYNGIQSKRIEENYEDGFFYLYGIKDFLVFVKEQNNNVNNLAYSDFNDEAFSLLLV